MTYVYWTVGIIIAIPFVSLLLGSLVVGLSLIVRAKVIPKGCGCCGKTGMWTRRNSLGFYLCDVCAGPSTTTIANEMLWAPKRRATEEMHL